MSRCYTNYTCIISWTEPTRHESSLFCTSRQIVEQTRKITPLVLHFKLMETKQIIQAQTKEKSDAKQEKGIRSI
jgi:hypothetical protein